MTLLYARKWASDDTLLILQWWFVLALTQAILLGTQGAVAAVWALAPFAVMTLLLLGVALVAAADPDRRRPLACCSCARSATGTAARGCCGT